MNKAGGMTTVAISSPKLGPCQHLLTTATDSLGLVARSRLQLLFCVWIQTLTRLCHGHLCSEAIDTSCMEELDFALQP